MLNIFRNLGKHWAACLAVVALLIVQANCDLALPGYTSDIVDVGIQQGGVDSALPDTLRDTTLQALKILMPDDEAAALEAAYAPADENGVRKLVKLAEFPERVPYDDGPGGDGPFLLRAHDGREFRAAQERLPRFDAVHVPGGDDDGGGVVRAQCLDDGKERGFFLFADGGQQDGLPGVKFRRQEFEQRVGHGGYGCGGGPVEFDVRHGLHSVAAEDPGETSGVRF